MLYSIGIESATKQTEKKNQILRLQMFTVKGKEQGGNINRLRNVRLAINFGMFDNFLLITSKTERLMKTSFSA